MLQYTRGKYMKNKKKEKTIKLYEALFIGLAVLILLYIVLIRCITPYL